MASVVAEKTFSSATIADIVGQASISRATFYKHFADKRACFDAAANSFVAELKEAATEARSSTGSRSEGIRRAIAAILEQLAAKPSYANLVLINAPILEPGIVANHRELAVEALKAQWGTGVGDMAGADARIAVGRAHVLVADYLVTDRADRLPELLPEISYIMLVPFVGHEEAIAQVRSAG